MRDPQLTELLMDISTRVQTVGRVINNADNSTRDLLELADCLMLASEALMTVARTEIRIKELLEGTPE